MAKSVEIEYKSMLTAAEFQQVITYFSLNEQSFKTQTNYYYDTPDLRLNAAGCGLRIRITPQHGELTLKTPLATGLLETTDPLTLAEAKSLIAKEQILLTGEVAAAIRDLNIDPAEIRLLAYLKTNRAEFPIQAGLLALDESWYGKTGHDYELELEVQDAAKGQADFKALLLSLKVQEKTASNKIQRAFKEIQR